MEARGITDEDLASHPGMKSVIYHAPPGNDNILDAEVLKGDYNGTPMLMVPWIVTEAEKAVILDGGTVWVTIFGLGMPPMIVTAEE